MARCTICPGNGSPWRPFIRALGDLLSLSGLREYRLRYFDNDPLEGLFADPDLRRFDETFEFLRQWEGSSLMIVSDAGAARGLFNREQLQRSRRFLDEARLCHVRAFYLSILRTQGPH